MAPNPGGSSSKLISRPKSPAYPVIPGTIGVARQFADLRSKFFNQIGDDDLWIAACVLTYPSALELATNDSGFTRIAAQFPLLAVKP